MRDDAYRLQRIAEIGNQLLGVIESRGITREQVLNDFETQWLITTPLFNIGEQANCVSAGLVVENPDIPWSQIAGLRHRLVHNYEGTNWSIVAAVVFDELETFIRQIEAMIVADDEVSPTEIETANR